MSIELTVFILKVFILGMLIAWVITIPMFIELMREKGYKAKNVALLWFIGIFASPIVLGLYVLALPTKEISSEKNSQEIM